MKKEDVLEKSRHCNEEDGVVHAESQGHEITSWISCPKCGNKNGDVCKDFSLSASSTFGSAHFHR